MVVPPKHPKMIIFSRKTHGCWGNPPFKESPHIYIAWALNWHINVWFRPVFIFSFHFQTPPRSWPYLRCSHGTSPRWPSFQPAKMHLPFESFLGSQPSSGWSSKTAKVGLPSREHHDMGPTKREVRKIIDSKVPWEVLCDRSQEGITSCGLFGERWSFLIVLKRPFLIDKREKILSEIVWMSDNLQLLVQLIIGQFRIQKRN